MSIKRLFAPPTPGERALARRADEARELAMTAMASAARAARLRDLRDDASNERLRAVIREQQVEIVELSVVVATLIETLADAGAVDEWALRTRIAAQIAELDESGDGRPDVPDPVATAAKATLGHDPRTESICGNCRGVFANNRTNLTPDGVRCDRCAAAAGY
jgi:hypothetical protein